MLGPFFILHKKLMFMWISDRTPTGVVIIIGTMKHIQSEDKFFHVLRST